MASKDLDRWLVNHETRAEVSSAIAQKVRSEEENDLDFFPLTVRQTNNLVRFLYSNGWISHEQHPDVHEILRQMIDFLEEKGIEVSLTMASR
jgi:hypothetical protein